LVTFSFLLQTPLFTFFSLLLSCCCIQKKAGMKSSSHGNVFAIANNFSCFCASSEYMRKEQVKLHVNKLPWFYSIRFKPPYKGSRGSSSSVERSFCIREALGSIPRFSKFFVPLPPFQMGVVTVFPPASLVKFLIFLTQAVPVHLLAVIWSPPCGMSHDSNSEHHG
jgi:hypothetical protein